MGNNEFAGRFVEFIFSWVKVLADGLWGVFSGTGKAGGGFLRWIGNHWLPILAFLLVGGIVVDWLVWIVRWRPYWLWFRKKRRVYDEQELDENYAEPEKKPIPVRRKPVAPRPAADPLFDVQPAPEPVDDLFDIEQRGENRQEADPLFDVSKTAEKRKKDVEWFDDNA